MNEIIWPALASILAFLSMMGWGWAAAVLIRIRDRIDLYLAGAYGLAFSTLFGGILNLFGLISLPLIRIYLLTGCVFFFYHISRRGRRAAIQEQLSRIIRDRIGLTVAIILFGMLFFKLVAAGVQPFNVHDDNHAYLVFPQKMIQTGSCREPFSERRMTALGGQSFLQALMLGLVDLEKIHIMDQGLAWLIFTALILGHGMKRGLSFRVCIGLLILCQLVKVPVVNISSVISGSVLFYALLCTFITIGNEKSISRAFLMGLVIAGLCSLKNSHIVGCAILTFLLYFFKPKTDFLEKGREFSTVVVISGLLLSPWMISLFFSNGTFLYPLLGKGYHGSAYTNFPSVTCGVLNLQSIYYAFRNFLTYPLFLIAALLALIPDGSGTQGQFRARVCRLAFIGTWTSSLLLLVLSDIWRYIFAMTFAVTMFQIIEFQSQTSANVKINQSRPLTSAFVSLLLFLYLCLPQGFTAYSKNWKRIQHPKKIQNADEIATVRAIQETIPPGQPVIARIAKPFLLNFSRNPIYVLDIPGGSSLPPGLPRSMNAEETARYFRSVSIRYLIYSYEDDRPLSKYGQRAFWEGNGYFKRVHEIVIRSFEIQYVFKKLGTVYKNLYNDGKIFVLDLD